MFLSDGQKKFYDIQIKIRFTVLSNALLVNCIKTNVQKIQIIISSMPTGWTLTITPFDCGKIYLHRFAVDT